MKNFKYIITLGTFLSFSILGITSCVDGNDWDTVTANRLFGPKDKNFSITPDENIAQFEVTWKGVKDAKSYILEISTSPLSDDIEMGTAEGSLVFGNGNDKITSSPYIIKELLPETSYYARIKAIGQGIESNWVYAEKTYKTVKEQLLYEPSEENGDITKNSIHISWMEGCKVTALRIYTTDKLYDETIQLDATAQKAAAYTFTDLTSLTDYTIELLNGEIKRGTIKVTTAMGDMIEVAVSEITSNSAKFTWGEAADSYTLIEGEAPTKDGAIQFDSSATTTFAASNLKDNTTYTFSVIRKGAVIGYCTFTTIKGLPANFTLISSGSELETALSTGSGEVALKINDGSVIELDKTITISKNITSLICFSDNMNTPPTIKTSGISVETGALLANMEFYNLKLTNEDSSNGYVVNIDQKCTIQKLTFEKCTISKLRGVFRAQKLESNGGLAATIGNITFNNSIIQNIGNYGVVNTYEDLSKKPEDAKYYTLTLGAIKFEKSTINTIGAQLIRILQEPNVVINQCTFYGLANKTVIDNNKEKKGTITISNTIVGKADTNKGYEGPTLTSNDTYTTSDCKFGSKNTWGTSIPISSTDLFVNAAEGDFTIQSSEYKAYGDPRWNK